MPGPGSATTRLGWIIDLLSRIYGGGPMMPFISLDVLVPLPSSSVLGAEVTERERERADTLESTGNKSCGEHERRWALDRYC